LVITCATDVNVRMEVCTKISKLFIQFVTRPTEKRKSWQNKFARCCKQSNCTRRICRQGTSIWLPDYWLEVSKHQEGPAIGHLTQNSVIFLGHTETAELLTSTLHCMLLTQPSPKLIPKFSPRRSATNTIKIKPKCCPLRTKFSPNAHLFNLLHTSNSPLPST
jgi:hypothetical protein